MINNHKIFRLPIFLPIDPYFFISVSKINFEAHSCTIIEYQEQKIWKFHQEKQKSLSESIT